MGENGKVFGHFEGARAGGVSGGLVGRFSPSCVWFSGLDAETVVDGGQEARHGLARARGRGLLRGLESGRTESCHGREGQVAEDMEEMNVCSWLNSFSCFQKK